MPVLISSQWPAIIGIIIACLIVISIIWCCARCLCCGAECCCGCLSCFNACCPSPRRKKDGYEQPPPQNYSPYNQYQSHQPPIYGGAGGYGYRGPQTATFEAPSKNRNETYNEDALPAMPSWQNAQSRHVEEDDVEMEKLDNTSAQQQSLLAANNDGLAGGGRYYNNQAHHDAGADLGTMHAGPYHDYDQHQQFAGSPVSTAQNSMYPPTYRTRPQSSVYEPQSAGPYAPSIPPSYRTAAPSIASPVQQPPPMPYAGVGRKPVQGSWRDV